MYCERTDLEAAVRDGVIDSWSGGDETKITKAIRASSSEIDGYLLSGGYTVPLSPVPDHIKDHAVSIALYNLAVVRGITDAPSDKELAAKKAAAIRFLEGVAIGKFQIPTAAEGTDQKSTRPGKKFHIKTGRKMDVRGFC